jgi:hypothetical protein
MHLKSRSLALLPAALVMAAGLGLVPAGCGARTGLSVKDAGADVIEEDAAEEDSGFVSRFECEEDDDCIGKEDLCRGPVCVEGKCKPRTPPDCDDHNPCTKDACNAASGQCTHETEARDLDGDGHRGPVPGHLPGDPDSCGDDCDDTSALAFPGNHETCDGVDNDCNGIIDDGAEFVPLGLAPVLVSDLADVTANAGGIAFGGTKAGYLSAYTSRLENQDGSVFLSRLAVSGAVEGERSIVNTTQGDAGGGPIVWTGDRYGMAWTDRRHENFEIYFDTFGVDGKKLGPDIRVTNAPDFSIEPVLGYGANEFYLAWQDRRGGEFSIFGRTLGLDGSLSGQERLLADEGPATGPAIAVSSKAIAVVYRVGDTNSSSVVLRLYAPGFQELGGPITIDSGEKLEIPAVVWNEGRAVVTWGRKNPHRIMGAVVNLDGTMAVAPSVLSVPDVESRRGLPLALGDRLLLVYAAEQTSGYDLVSRSLFPSLMPQGNPAVITTSIGDDMPQALTFGPAGDIGVFFDGKVGTPDGKFKGGAFFTRLRCAIGAGPE